MKQRALRFGAALAAASLAVIAPTGGADAEVKPAGLGGIRGSATASGLHVFYNPKGLLPTGPPVDLGSPDALATIATGPITFARAGVADPGDLLANPDAVLTQFNASYPSGTIPPWPFRLTASSAVGAPMSDQTPAPGLHAHVEANENDSRATASMPGAEAPAIANVSSVVADTTTKTDDDKVTVHARVSATGFNLLGLVKIDSVVTDFTATSDAETAKFTGATTVVGATVMNKKVTIDSDGIHSASKVVRSVNSLLSKAGIKISVADPVTNKSGAAGSREGAGLRIDMELSSNTVPALQSLIDSLPTIPNPIPGAPGIGDLLAVAQARHTVAIHLAGASVSVDARPAAVFDEALPADLGSDDIVPSIVSGFDLGSSTSLPDQMALPKPTGTATTTPVSNSLPLGSGVGGFLLLALLVQPLLGWRLAKASSAMLGGASTYCPEEDL